MIKFLDLKKLNQTYADELCAAASHVVQSGQYILGRSVFDFERNFANYVGSSHCVGVGNGLDAISLTLKAWVAQGKIRTGDEVLVPANTFVATVLAVIQAGLRPVLVDPDTHTFNITVDTCEQVYRTNCKVLVPVHLYGSLCPMTELVPYARSRGLLVVEDAAQAHGAFNDWGSAGSFGDAAAFSFYPGKNLGALGDGGAITTDDEELARQVRSLANYGSSEKYVHQDMGVNSRLDEMQAAFLNIKLRALPKEIKKRISIAEEYVKLIQNEHIRLPTLSTDGSHAYHLFVVRVKNRPRFQKHMHSNGVETSVHYPIPIYRQKCFKNLGLIGSKMIDELHDEVVSLPLNSALSSDEIIQIITACNSYAP